MCSWVYPQIILENVCEACRDLAMAAVNNNNLYSEVSGSEEAGPSTRGHTNVCLLRGCSTLQRQGDKILRVNPTEMQQSIINIIESKVAMQEISSADHVCHACWSCIKREIVCMNRQDESRPQLDTIDDVQPEENVILPSTTTQPDLTQIVELADYRRAAHSTHTCVYPNCSSTKFHNISDKLRATVLHNHNYICQK